MITQIISATVVLLAAAGGCGGDAKPPADDGRLQFHTFGRIAYGKHLKAHDMPRGGTGCRWSIEVEPITGLKPGEKPRVVGKGDGGNAKIYLPEKPDTVITYLVTNGCGRWS